MLGHAVDPKNIATLRRVGYMSQAFSLYSELSVRQNLVLHAHLFSVPEADTPGRVDEMVQRFSLGEALSMVHQSELIILDEPTSGVDPIARVRLWQP